jgi:hypothetical protein
MLKYFIEYSNYHRAYFKLVFTYYLTTLIFKQILNG